MPPRTQAHLQEPKDGMPPRLLDVTETMLPVLEFQTSHGTPLLEGNLKSQIPRGQETAELVGVDGVAPRIDGGTHQRLVLFAGGGDDEDDIDDTVSVAGGREWEEEQVKISIVIGTWAVKVVS